jgi:hypothetical protein
MPLRPTAPYVAANSDFYVHVLFRAAQSGDHGIAIGEVQVGDGVVEIVENFQRRQDSGLEMRHEPLEDI